MCTLFLFYILCFFGLFPALMAQDVESYAGDAPTSFQTRVHHSSGASPQEVFQQSPSSEFRSTGGVGKVQTYSVRGSSSKDVAVSLEGIPLNLPSQGYFNFGDLSLFGLGDIQIIRGGYSPFSSDPQAQVRLRLPRHASLQSQLSIGSLGYESFNQLSPNGSFSFNHGTNDFLYDTGAGYAHRQHNESINLNLRLWFRKASYQIWTQLIDSSQEIPKDLSYSSSTESELETLRPLIAFQGELHHWQYAFWMSFQNEAYSDSSSHSESNSYSSGERIERNKSLMPSLSWKNSLEFQQDHLSTESYSTSLQNTVSLSSSVLWAATKNNLLHPRLRIEFISDLDQALSAHPGMGGRHLLTKDLSVLWNAALISRAPTLVERFYKTNSISPNPQLKRQNSWQADAGYEWNKKDRGFHWTQSFFVDRTTDLIEFDNSAKTSINGGNALTYGVENELNWEACSFFSLKAQYSYMIPMQGDNDQMYQARHQFNAIPHFFPGHFVQISLPLMLRSKMRTYSSGIPKQIDLGASLSSRWKNFQMSLRLFNLLGWRRQDVEGFPLPQQTWFRFSLSHFF